MKTSLLKFKASTVAAGLLLAVGASAFAGECPAGKEGNNPLASAPTAPVGITDTELAAIDLSKENVKLSERRLRLRKMTIAPDGIVPLHSHADRPALIRVDAGEIFENNSKCTVPILHKAGDVAKEFLGTKHWWKNDSGKPVELTITDLVNDKKADPMKDMM
jgi:quercetin dioxygenase-like cupin family protein